MGGVTSRDPFTRILVVDDDPDARALLEATLIDAGYRDVISTDSAEGAFDALVLGRTNRNSSPP